MYYILRLVENIELKSMHFALIKKYKKGYYFLHFYKRELGKFSSQQFYLAIGTYLIFLLKIDTDRSTFQQVGMYVSYQKKQCLKLCKNQANQCCSHPKQDLFEKSAQSWSVIFILGLWSYGRKNKSARNSVSPRKKSLHK